MTTGGSKLRLRLFGCSISLVKDMGSEMLHRNVSVLCLFARWIDVAATTSPPSGALCAYAVKCCVFLHYVLNHLMPVVNMVQPTRHWVSWTVNAGCSSRTVASITASFDEPCSSKNHLDGINSVEKGCNARIKIHIILLFIACWKSSIVLEILCCQQW